MRKLYGVVYKMILNNYNKFYVGSTKQDIDKYWGSGTQWNKFINEHNIERNDENIKEEILVKIYTNEKDLREAEEKEIIKYCSKDKFNDFVVSDPNCLNVDPYTDSFYKRPGKCNECGYELQSRKHAKTCSKYKKEKVAKPCEECGVIKGHVKTCSKYNAPKPCPECGGVRAHFDTCSKTKGKCPECGYSLKSNKHAKTCSKYKPLKESEPCSECGGRYGQHFKSCSRYTSNTLCPECGHSPHIKTCSKYKMDKNICEECHSTCGNHKSWCSHYKMPVCGECGCTHGFHSDDCSKAKGTCLECGYSLQSNLHAPSCSHYVDTSCEFCGSRSRHKLWCAKNKSDKAKSISYVCIECKGVDGKHEKNCSLKVN